MIRNERVRQVLAAAAILGGVLVLTLGIRAASFLPGVTGEFFGMITGVLSTPVFLEISFFLMGFMIVLALNHWRMKKEGDEFVYLDQIQEPETTHLPDQAKWAIYKTKPLPGEEPSLLVQAEGALEIGDLQAAADAVAAMEETELHLPETTALRIRLARASGREDLARKLEAGH
ncbi:hypothetical protein KBB96_14885 [Luteolibacter ambystomatis]|uniref:Uncharacterized protein n=1 Tax=Luteolibacter ambystomatis TaxID=2824561 RepID=A0A975G6C2_9BACT|nr:hypothetical protein [Luteolibacter ambystomatis]QUE50149.1 hypothetical protein KBB96_14885 [Luteolibacter ambystomatis]